MGKAMLEGSSSYIGAMIPNWLAVDLVTLYVRLLTLYTDMDVEYSYEYSIADSMLMPERTLKLIAVQGEPHPPEKAAKAEKDSTIGIEVVALEESLSQTGDVWNARIRLRNTSNCTLTNVCASVSCAEEQTMSSSSVAQSVPSGETVSVCISAPMPAFSKETLSLCIHVHFSYLFLNLFASFFRIILRNACPVLIISDT
jgi:hypothetical protein